MTTPAHLVRLMMRKALPNFVKLFQEEKFSISVADNLRYATLQGRVNGIWFHVKNEHSSGSKKAPPFVLGSKGYKVNKDAIRNLIGVAMGVIPGALDFVFINKENGGSMLELKCGASLSDNQKDFIVWCEENGVRTATVRAKTPETGWPLVEKVLVEWGYLKPSGFKRA